MFSFQGTLKCSRKNTFEKLPSKFLKTVLGGDEESPVFATQIPPAQRPNTSYSVPVSHHSLIKQSTGLFFLIVRAFRSSTLKVFTINSLLSFWYCLRFSLVEMRRVELLTPCLQGRCSPNWATPPHILLGPHKAFASWGKGTTAQRLVFCHLWQNL